MRGKPDSSITVHEAEDWRRATKPDNMQRTHSPPFITSPRS